MDWIVTTARTVEEAQTRALDLLGVDTADAEIQVIEEGKTGLFGRTKSEARVRARIKPKAPPAKEERRPSRGGGDRNRNRGGNRGSGGGNNKSGNRDGGNRDGGNRDGGNRDGGNRDGGGRNRSRGANNGSSNNRGSGRDGGDRAPKQEDAPAVVASGADEGRNSGSGNRGSGRDGGARDGGGRSRNRGGNRQRNDRDSGSRDNEDRVEMPVDEQRETLESFVTGVATAFDPAAKVELVEEGTTLQARVTGVELGRLVGAKASTLQSLEELARTAMHRAAAGRRYHRIQVDVDNYRGRRREALAKFATDLASSVAESGESKAMEPMGAADRKLIHDAVAEVSGVETMSEGRDPRRYIVILATDVSDEEE
jgi:spoIIIJ-associated protein